MIGYSLGSQVIKSCIKTLHFLYDNPSDSLNTSLSVPQDILQNVTFMAGATHFTKNIEKYKNIFKYTVNGQTKNVFSEGD